MLLCGTGLSGHFPGGAGGPLGDDRGGPPGAIASGYEHVGWLINGLAGPPYWENYFLRILSVGSGPELGGTGPLLVPTPVYVWLHRERFGHSAVRAHRRGDQFWSRRRSLVRPVGTSSITWISTACLCTPIFNRVLLMLLQRVWVLKAAGVLRPNGHPEKYP